MPSQAILLARRADDALGILVHFVAVALLESIVVLGFHIAVADCDGVQFVGANAAVEEFLPAGFPVKEPLISPLHNRDGERPVLIADEEKRPVPALRVYGHALLFAGFRSKVGGVLLVLRIFAG